MTGAVRPERIVSAMMPASTRKPPPNFFRVSRSVSSTMKASSFGAISMPIVPTNTQAARIGSCAGHCRKQRKSLRKIFGPDELRLQRDQNSEHQKDQPERRGEIRSDPGQQMKPRDPVKAARRQQRQMLQIALTPAPVARGKIRKRGRGFLVTAAERRRHVDGPAAAPHQRRLDEVVAEDMPAERLASPQFGKPGILRKGADANDGVVSPVIAFGAVPPCDPGGHHRTV